MRVGPPIVIIGHRCTDCGRAAFPPDPFGCEQCGATTDRLEETELSARGQIHALATVHRHHHDRPETPFTVATIVLDDGPTLKAVLTGDLEGAGVGSEVVGVTTPWDSEGDVETVDLRFSLSSRVSKNESEEV